MSTNEERAQMLYDKALAELNTYLENYENQTAAGDHQQCLSNRE